ncbi:MAG: hypothetical protein GWN58_36310, partial [Anaerolineae bacterium]|nr:hypothetical protein [Anaerolineae bacterium]
MLAKPVSVPVLGDIRPVPSSREGVPAAELTHHVGVACGGDLINGLRGETRVQPVEIQELVRVQDLVPELRAEVTEVVELRAASRRLGRHRFLGLTLIELARAECPTRLLINALAGRKPVLVHHLLLVKSQV